LQNVVLCSVTDGDASNRNDIEFEPDSRFGSKLALESDNDTPESDFLIVRGHLVQSFSCKTRFECDVSLIPECDSFRADSGHKLPLFNSKSKTTNCNSNYGSNCSLVKHLKLTSESDTPHGSGPVPVSLDHRFESDMGTSDEDDDGVTNSNFNIDYCSSAEKRTATYPYNIHEVYERNFSTQKENID